MPPRKIFGKQPGETVPVANYRIEFAAHLPVDDRHNQTIVRSVVICVPADEILQTIRVVREDSNSWETVAEFEAVDPARNRYPFTPKDGWL